MDEQKKPVETVKVWREDTNYLGKVTKISANMPIGPKFTNSEIGDEEAGIKFYVKNGWKRVDEKKEAKK